MRNPDSRFLYVKNMSNARVEQEEISENEQKQAIQEAELIKIEPQLDLYDPSFVSEVESLLLSKIAKYVQKFFDNLNLLD